MCSGLIVSIAANAAEGRRTETVSRFAPAGPGPGAAAAPPSAQTGRQTATTRPQRIVCFFIIERILTDKESLVAPKPQNTAPKVTPAHALQTTAPLRERLRSVGQNGSQPRRDGMGSPARQCREVESGTNRVPLSGRHEFRNTQVRRRRKSDREGLSSLAQSLFSLKAAAGPIAYRIRPQTASDLQ